MLLRWLSRCYDENFDRKKLEIVSIVVAGIYCRYIWFFSPVTHATPASQCSITYWSIFKNGFLIWARRCVQFRLRGDASPLCTSENVLKIDREVNDLPFSHIFHSYSTVFSEKTGSPCSKKWPSDPLLGERTASFQNQSLVLKIYSYVFFFPLVLLFTCPERCLWSTPSTTDHTTWPLLIIRKTIMNFEDIFRMPK